MILTLLLTLIVVIIAVNYTTYKSLDADASFVNFAGRLRASSYRMAQISANLVMNPTENQKMSKELQERIQFFDILLPALINGDREKGLNELKNENIKNQIYEIQKQWTEKFRPAYEEISKSADIKQLKIINQDIDNYVMQIDKMVTAYAEYSQGKVRKVQFISVFILVISLIVSVFSALIIRKGIIHPISLISNEMQEISSGTGDLTKQLQFKGRNEIGALTGNFNKFVSDIRDIVISIASSSSVLNDSLDSISSTSEELAKSTEMIAVAVQEVSSGSNEQSNMVKKLKDLIDIMKENINHVIQKADTLLQQSENAKSSAKEGNEIIEREVNELKLLVENTNQVATSVDNLQINSEDIANILEIISNISSQTNLLALNASIEAARAGEAGRGFAVVAEAIRKLAEETSQSTVKIGDIVKSITEQTVSVKKHMDDMVGRINIQEDNMNRVQTKLNEIYEKSNKTYEESNRIKEINYHVKDNFTVIYESANKITQVVENNSQNTQDVAAAVEEQTASFEEVSANLASLNELSKKLNEIVLKFKV